MSEPVMTARDTRPASRPRVAGTHRRQATEVEIGPQSDTSNTSIWPSDVDLKRVKTDPESPFHRPIAINGITVLATLCRFGGRLR